MAKKRGKPAPSAGGSPAAADEGKVAKTGPEERSRPAARRERRPYIYAGFDFAFAALYAFLLAQVPTRHGLHGALLWSTVAAVVVAGAGMMVRNRWGWRAAVAGCGALLLVACVLLVLVLLSASFLSGVYGSMGQGAAMMALMAGAIIIELCGVLPALQLKFLMTRAGRRWFRGEAHGVIPRDPVSSSGGDRSGGEALWR
jgi:hypothetical protein